MLAALDWSKGLIWISRRRGEACSQKSTWQCIESKITIFMFISKWIWSYIIYIYIEREKENIYIYYLYKLRFDHWLWPGESQKSTTSWPVYTENRGTAEGWLQRTKFCRRFSSHQQIPTEKIISQRCSVQIFGCWISHLNHDTSQSPFWYIYHVKSWYQPI